MRSWKKPLLNPKTRSLAAGLLAIALFVAGAGEARADYTPPSVTCTPGVRIGALENGGSGFTLGCASPALWSILSIDYGETRSYPDNVHNKLRFQSGSGTANSTPGVRVGIYGGRIETSADTVFPCPVGTTCAPPGDIVATDGIYPSTATTDVSKVYSGVVVKDNELMIAARADTLHAVDLITDYVAAHYNDANTQRFDSGISSAVTPLMISAKQDGLNLITVGTDANRKSINLNGVSEILKFSSGTFQNVQFIVNITEHFILDNQAQVVVSTAQNDNPLNPNDDFVSPGLNYTDVLFNLSKGSGYLKMDHGSVLNGILVDSGDSGPDLITNNSILRGMMIGGGDMTLSNNSHVYNSAIPYGCQVAPPTDDPQNPGGNPVLICLIYQAPEPATLALIALGLLSIFGAGWRARVRARRFAPLPL